MRNCSPSFFSLGPEHVKAWWGPESVVCKGAEIDLRVGGRYRIANEFSDGIRSERVTVKFEPHPAGTEVVVIHERIARPAGSDVLINLAKFVECTVREGG